MLTWFPSPYPEEQFNSVLCRYYLSSGIKEHYLVKKQLFGTKAGVKMATLYPNATVHAALLQLPDGVFDERDSNFFYLCDEPFWANFSPDRLHDLEQLILRKLKLPSKLQEIYVEADFFVFVYGSEIQNIEETRETRRKAIEAWKQKNFKVEVRPWPKFVIKEKQDEE